MGKGLDRTGFASSSVTGAELVIGIVAPLGTDVEFVEKTLHDRLEHFGYALAQIRVSHLIGEFEGLKVELKHEPLYERIVSHMDAGNELRKQHRRGDVLALAAIGGIQKARKKAQKAAEPKADQEGPSPNTAFLVRSLKHPDEVHTLREVYGRGFFLIGVSAPRDARLNVLVEQRRIPPKLADKLLLRDESEAEGHGQQTRDAFQLADAFCALGDNEKVTREQLWRLLDLLFGQPFITPTLDEYSMFMAYAASVRSADLSRQVGAVIVSKEGEVLATGANDVPAPNGGAYWSEGYLDWPKSKPSDDHRDWVLGFDSNRTRRDEIAQEVGKRVREAERQRVVNALAELLPAAESEDLMAKLEEAVTAPGTETDVLEVLAGTKLMDLTEYGRAVHAEMDALMACVRTGSKARGARLVCTTFPCHNCTKHIVSAGISEVVYIEPYPKSLAEELYPEAVESQGPSGPGARDSRGSEVGKRVAFRPFTGVGPRKYLDLFSLSLSTGRPLNRKRAAQRQDWTRNAASLRVSMVPTSYLDREREALNTLDESTKGHEQ